MGRAARPSPHRRARRGGGGPLRRRRRRHRARRAVVHRLRLLHRELEAPRRGGALPHELQPGAAGPPPRRAPRAGRAAALHRPPGLARAQEHPARHGRGDGADQAQPRPHVHDRVQLRGPGRDRRRGPGAGGRGGPGGQDLGEGAAPPPLRPGHAGPRPRHPHVGRVPHLQLPALGAGLRRAVLQSPVLARVPPRPPLRGDPGVPGARPPLRRRSAVPDRRVRAA